MDALLTAVVSGIIVAIASAFLAFYFGGVRERQKREYEEQKEAQRRQEEQQKEAQRRKEGLTERLTQVSAQLGSSNLETRLGAIYALEAIANESDAHYWPIMEVLTAYVRQHTRDDAAIARRKAEPEEVRTPDIDIKAIMTVLRRRTRSFGHGEPEPLDLNRAYLWGAQLARADLTKANLRGAILTNALLPGAILKGADLAGTIFSLTVLIEADLTKANLTEEAFLTLADLAGANLTEANLVGANLRGAQLARADLGGADLGEANLWGAKHPRLTQGQLDSTRSGDENTRLPSGLNPPAHWGVKTDEPTEGD